MAMNIPGQPGYRDPSLLRLAMWLRTRDPRFREQVTNQRRNTGVQNVPSGVTPAEIARIAMGDGTTQITGRPSYPLGHQTPAALSGAAADVPTANAFQPRRPPAPNWNDPGYDPAPLYGRPRRIF